MDGRMDGRTDGGDNNIPSALLKKRGDKKDTQKKHQLGRVSKNTGGLKTCLSVPISPLETHWKVTKHKKTKHTREPRPVLSQQ